MEPMVARQTFRTLEPVHGMIYFAPQARPRYEALGLDGGRMGYFASRSAPMGAVPAEVVIATFFNFNPELVRKVIPAAWERATPAAIIEARFAAAGDALRVALGDTVASDEMVEAAGLARQAAEAACARPEGRPLFAGHASLAWPDDPHLVLWHAQTLLREFRGDAHVAALTLSGWSGIDALVTHAASGDITAEALRTSRAWSEDQWATAVDDLRGRGVVAPGPDATALELTDAGRAQRQWVEDTTDAMSAAAYEVLGTGGCKRLRELGREVSKAVMGAGLLG